MFTIIRLEVAVLAFGHIPEEHISQEIIKLIPAEIAQHYGVVPVECRGQALVIAIADPTDVSLLDRN